MDQLTTFLTQPLVLGLIWAIYSLGVFIAYRVLDIADLSAEGVMPLAAVLSLFLINIGLNPVLALLLSVISGILMGALNGCMQIYLKIPPLLSGIIIMIGLFSVVFVLSVGNIWTVNPTIFTEFYNIFESMFGSRVWGKWLGNFLVIAVIAAIVVAALYFFFGTEMGVAIRAIGLNKKMSKAQGINTSLMTIVALAISSGLVALAGGILGQYKTYITATEGNGSIVIALSVLFLGEVVFGKRSFKNHLISIILGGLLYWYVISAILLIPRFDTSYLFLVQAVVLVTVLVAQNLIKKGVIGKKRLVASDA